MPGLIDWIQNRVLGSILRTLDDHENRITTTEEKMASTDEVIARLNTATTRIAARLQALVEQVAGNDTATAAKFEPLIAELEAMGTDPVDPVPDPGPGG